MRVRLVGIGALLVLLLAWMPAFADDQTKAVPNLVGTWTGEKSIYFLKGEKRSVDVLEITEQSDAHFGGTRSWRHVPKSKPMGHVSGDHVSKTSDPFLE